ncbi:hypothetical protein SAMN04488121_106285 [Chitinophaga filiformis]|uniref:Uncharacterized protein n=1 Tax=Chitinophaga filiformis TaxID=104663 RepID=A0A1G7X546_CHIFI|nr:hypothetical protein SAMN04488121_106285 [Chitinophaga filiformis]
MGNNLPSAYYAVYYLRLAEQNYYPENFNNEVKG